MLQLLHQIAPQKLQRLECANAIAIAATHAITDTGVTSIYIMKGTPTKNPRWADHPITTSLLDGSKVSSIHICNIIVPGLPTILTGHIVPGITMASLIGIRILCKVSCKVIQQKVQNTIQRQHYIMRVQRPHHRLMDPTAHHQSDCKDHPGRSLDKPQQHTHDSQPPCGTCQSANIP